MALYLNANFTDFVVPNQLFYVVLNGCNNLLSEHTNFEENSKLIIKIIRSIAIKESYYKPN